MLIKNKLVELYDFWFQNKNIWFHSNPQDDKEISDSFLDLYLDKDKLDLSTTILNKKHSLAMIILYDQIPRHLVRNKDIPYENIQNDLQYISNYSYQFYIKYKEQLTDYEFCFSLMPLRHLDEFDFYQFILKETWDKLNDKLNTQESIDIYKHYLKITYLKCPLKDIFTNYSKYKLRYNQQIIQNIFKDYNDILDKNSIFREYDIVNNKNNNIQINTLNINNNSKLLISISGGVDSMVLSKLLLNQIKDKNRLVLVHINYNNRNTCDKEKSLLIKWANILNLPLYIRDIYEINRDTCMKWGLREMYETYTQNVRYSFYQQVAQEIKVKYNNYYVLLGHNKDDCLENILTNISKKQKYDNLYGMDMITPIKHNQQTIYLWRPMLNISKQNIYQYANHYNIPYLNDSTPSWSQRGQIRDNVIPCLNNWNSNFIQGLIDVKKTIEKSYQLIDMIVNEYISKSKRFDITQCNELIKNYHKLIENYKNIREIKLDKLYTQTIFWKSLFNKLNVLCSHKSIEQFISQLIQFQTKNNKNYTNIQLSKQNTIFIIYKNNQYILLICNQ